MKCSETNHSIYTLYEYLQLVSSVGEGYRGLFLFLALHSLTKYSLLATTTAKDSPPHIHIHKIIIKPNQNMFLLTPLQIRLFQSCCKTRFRMAAQ